jgi:hypothetical protein
MRIRPLIAAAAVSLALAAAPSAANAIGRTASAPAWAPAATATIHPGVQVLTNGSQCTANFIFSDGTNTFIGQAAHCSGTDGNTATNGCTSHSLPVGTAVTVTGASKPGTMVYNSWLTMQKLGEADADTCQYNDLALVQLDPSDVASVNPSVPVWGGPNALSRATLSTGDRIYSYGNSELRLGLTQLSPKTGISNGDTPSGWSHGTTMVTPGIPGDSGSGLLDPSGNAAGILSTVGISLPDGATNNFGDLAHELDYLHSHEASFAGVQLVAGTVAFNGSAVPIG